MLYLSIYILLSLGAVTMVIPFVIMIAGSVESSSQFVDSVAFPRYTTDRTALWRRFLEAKYQGNPSLLRMAWGDSGANYLEEELPPHALEETATWEAFTKEVSFREPLQSIGFIRNGNRLPSYYGREFRLHLLKQYDGDLGRLNQSLQTRFSVPSAITVPIVNINGASVRQTPLVEAFYSFAATVPASRKFAWDAGGYYRAVFLPRLLGPDVSAYNQKYGTSHASYREVPFPTVQPEEGSDLWFLFVSRELRPDFVELTEAGRQRQRETGLGKMEFINLKAQEGDLRVSSLDCIFAQWAEDRMGISRARIPQRALDWAEFEAESGFWKRQFLVQNYLAVFDEVFAQGRALMNTLILVTLVVCGTLIVNPLAAYALSRFKMRKTYHILIFCLATIAFPAEVTMIPVFLQMKELHLLNTFGALVIPGLANGFSIFLLKGFFDSLPQELYEAAEIDGASEWTMFWHIAMNLSRPILAVKALAAFVGAYGMFFYALILAPDPEMWTIMVYIYQLRQLADSPVVYASLILTAIPTLLVFVFCQNIILRGIVVPSEK